MSRWDSGPSESFFGILKIESLIMDTSSATSRPRRLACALAVLLLSTWLGCSNDQVSGDRGDTGSPVPDTLGDGHVASDIFDGDSSRGGDPDGGTTGDAPHDSQADAADADRDTVLDDCTCPDPSMACVVDGSSIVCGPDPAQSCSSSSECPDGLGCMSGRCVCDPIAQGEQACLPVCQTDTDCPSLFRCSLEGRCVTPPPCQSDTMCPQSKWCVQVDDSIDRYCTTTGPREDGEACERDEQCLSGKCLGTCLTRCLQDSDCQTGRHCSVDYGYCTSRSCRTECPADGVCDGDKCHDKLCRSSGDCATSDCFVGPNIPGSEVGGCLPDEESYCKTNEFRTRSDDPFCRLPVLCEDGSECPLGYTCVVNDHPSDPYRAVWCSRRVAEWSWPP